LGENWLLTAEICKNKSFSEKQTNNKTAVTCQPRNKVFDECGGREECREAQSRDGSRVERGSEWGEEEKTTREMRKEER